MDIKFKDLTSFDASNIVPGILKALIDNKIYDINQPRQSLYNITVRYNIEARYDAGRVFDTTHDPDDEFEKPLDAVTPLENEFNNGINTIYIDNRFAPCDSDDDDLRKLKSTYFNNNLAHEVAHFILRHKPECSYMPELGTPERLAYDLEFAANSRGVIGDEELAEYVAAVLLCMPINPSSDLKILCFDTIWANFGGNLRKVARHYNVPIDCVIKLAALKTYRLYETHYFKWNCSDGKMEDAYVPSINKYDLSLLNPYDPSFWQAGTQTAVGICFDTDADADHESDLLSIPYHCWAYLDKECEELERPEKIHVLGYPTKDNGFLPSLDHHFDEHKTKRKTKK